MLQITATKAKMQKESGEKEHYAMFCICVTWTWGYLKSSSNLKTLKHQPQSHAYFSAAFKFFLSHDYGVLLLAEKYCSFSDM